MDDSLSAAPLKLTRTELSVLRELGIIDAGSSHPRLARAYRRMLELAKGDDELDGMLAAHLVRDLLAALPRMLGVARVLGHSEYRDLIDRIATSWPSESRAGGNVPDETAGFVRDLLDDHEGATIRARGLARAVLSWADPAASPYVPELAIDRWIELSRASSGRAHGVKETDRSLPSQQASRRLVDEVTGLLFAIFAPYLTSIDEIDRLLNEDDPSPEDARALVDLLTTPNRYAYAFERLDARWVESLAGIDRLLTVPPRLVPRGDGYVLTPPWPQGRYLARMAPIEPSRVEELMARVPATDNPIAILVMVEIARALPADAAARLAPDLGRRLSVPLAAEYAAVDTGTLVVNLADAGHAVQATGLMIATVDAVLRGRRDLMWHLEQLLGDPLGTLAPLSDDLAEQLRRLLRRTIGARRRGGRYSTIWLRDIERRQRYGVDAVWLLANALYRTLVAAPLEPARRVIGDLLSDAKPVMSRIALEAIASRPELVVASDEIVGDPARWDDHTSTRWEFRRALGVLWPGASDTARASLLGYAEAASEAHEAAMRTGSTGEAHRESIKRWRSRLLFAVRERLPQEWVASFGPIEAMADERSAEPTAEWVGSVSPVPETELASLSAAEMLDLLRDWQPPMSPSLFGPSLEGLARAAAPTVVARFGEFADTGAVVAGLRPRLVAAITSEVRVGLREGRIHDRTAGLRFILEIAVTPPRMQAGNGDDGSVETRIHVADVVAHAANEGYLDPEDIDRSLAVLASLLHDPDPHPGADIGDGANGLDVGMLALNSVRGAATTATIEFLLWSRRNELPSLADATAAMLRRAVESDFALSVRAAYGIRLPWLLANDPDHRAEWLELLFGLGVADPARAAAWEGYLIYSRFFRESVPLLAEQYADAVVALEPRETEDRGRPHDHEEQLGVHVALAHLFDLPQEAEGAWLATFFDRTAPWLRARVIRWLGEQAASAEVGLTVQARAREFIQRRIEAADQGRDAEELKAVGWIAPATDDQLEVLERIVLPALEKTRGETENESGLLDLFSRTASELPHSTARALHLLVTGDPWRSLPHIAGDALRGCLATLLASDDASARGIAVDTVNTLAAQGFIDYRHLVDGEGAAS